ncbi:MAG: hypothetical protein KKF50_04760 [Nanoarchaeota archaeon]|nr:hypothetical protein [Nanoarchaeota archaeon]
MKFKFNKYKVVISVLVILLILSLGYISFDSWKEKKNLREISIYQAGMNEGYAQAIIGVMAQADSCDPVSVYEGNNTVNLINVECLVQE